MSQKLLPFHKDSFSIQVIVLFSSLIISLLGLTLLERFNIISNITKDALNLVSFIIFGVFFYKIFKPLQSSALARTGLFSIIGFGLLDYSFNLLRSLDLLIGLPALQPVFLYRNIISDLLMSMTILSLVFFFIIVIRELQTAQKEIVEQEARLRKEAEWRLRMERNRRKKSRNEIVGELTAGVAHEFNNILTITLGNLSFAELKCNKESRPYIEKATESGERAAALVHKLLAFCRKRDMKMEQVDLNETIRQLHFLRKSTVDPLISFIIENRLNEAYINANEGALMTVLINYIKNANDAVTEKLPAGGSPHKNKAHPEIRIEVDEVSLDEHDAARKSKRYPGDFAVIRIKDNGCGMTEETIEKLFMPFFTTKEVGFGVGLDLAESKGIIEEHNGWIEVASEAGKGTTFMIYLPLMKPSKNAPQKNDSITSEYAMN